MKVTQAERKALQEFMNRFGEYNEARDHAFHLLQDMCRDRGMDVYCCAKTNYEQLKAAGVPNVDALYENYIRMDAHIDLIGDYGQMLAEIGFWRDEK